MRMVTASGRSRWPYVIGAVILVAAISGGVAYNATRPDTRPVPLTSPTTATSTPKATSSITDLADDVAPTGCLGGLDRNLDMVLAAQESAKHTTYGAVEAATAIYRWLWQYPTPSKSESDVVGADIISIAAPEVWRDVTAQYESDFWLQKISEYKTRDGEFHTSSTNGLWRVTEQSTVDEVNVELSLGTVIDGALSPTSSTVSGFTMVWESGGWHLKSGFGVDETRLLSGGTQFTGGC